MNFAVTGSLMLIGFLSLSLISNTAVADPTHRLKSLLTLSLEELTEVEIITSVSKKAQSIHEAAAAIFVISREDLLRSGVTHLADALKMVPGLHVTKANANAWAVSVRGFHDIYASDLLVLVDGRSLYTPDFAGVWWEDLSLVFEDIERIEVIRGPGGTVWGANAVNGVINIITRSSQDTTGTLLKLSGGTELQGAATVRQGGALTGLANGFYRLYAQTSHYDRSANAIAPDDWQHQQAGFRIDQHIAGDRQWKLQGDVYQLKKNEITDVLAPRESQFSGGNLLAFWDQSLDARRRYQVQAYYDYTDKDSFGPHTTNHSAEIEARYRQLIGSRHDLMMGLGVRWLWLKAADRLFSYHPRERRKQLYNFFIQDEISFLDNQLLLTVGSKFEHNDDTGWEIQPNLRLLWQATPRLSFWGAISRAVRTPSRAELDADVNVFFLPDATSPLLLDSRVTGEPNNEAETVLAYELGLRQQPTNDFRWDLTFFYNDYNKLIHPELYPTPDLARGVIVLDNKIRNNAEAISYGVEWAGDWQVLPEWRLVGSYSYLRLGFYTTMLLNINERDVVDASPKHHISLRSQWDFAPDWQFDFWLRYVDTLKSRRFTPVPSYWTLDARLAWQVSDRFSLSVVGQHLLDDQRPEFNNYLINRLLTETERAYYAQVRWQFD